MWLDTIQYNASYVGGHCLALWGVAALLCGGPLPVLCGGPLPVFNYVGIDLNPYSCVSLAAGNATSYIIIIVT